jgi:hypothetical protein
MTTLHGLEKTSPGRTIAAAWPMRLQMLIAL